LFNPIDDLGELLGRRDAPTTHRLSDFPDPARPDLGAVFLLNKPLIRGGVLGFSPARECVPCLLVTGKGESRSASRHAPDHILVEEIEDIGDPNRAYIYTALVLDLEVDDLRDRPDLSRLRHRGRALGRANRSQPI